MPVYISQRYTTYYLLAGRDISTYVLAGKVWVRAMEDKGRDTIAAFDTLLTTNHLRMMKVLLSYLAPEQQGSLAVYIKFSELQYTLQLLKRSPPQPIFRGHRTILTPQSLLGGNLLENDFSGVLELLEELLPFSGPKERARIKNIRNFLSGMSQLREMMEMMEMMRELYPEGMGSTDNMTDMSSMGDMFSAMSGVDPTMLMQMVQMLQSAQPDSTNKSNEK